MLKVDARQVKPVLRWRSRCCLAKPVISPVPLVLQSERLCDRLTDERDEAEAAQWIGGKERQNFNVARHKVDMQMRSRWRAGCQDPKIFEAGIVYLALTAT